MPELPEVETIKRGVENHIKDVIIEEVGVFVKALRKPIPQDQLQLLIGCKINSVKRRAKYLIIGADKGLSLIIHLGMSGSLVIANGQYERKKHDHLVITLSNEYKIIFNDPRRFGLIDVCNTEGFEKLDYIKGLGPEPFDSNCTVQYLKTKFSKRSISIKQALMDNKILVGIGNIYASEILFLASVSPLRKANMITNPEIKKIHKAIDIILSKAINAGGSTLKDYKKADGTIGGFQNKFVVYGKQDEQCSRCKSLIKSVNQGGRRSFYCSNCQS